MKNIVFKILNFLYKLVFKIIVFLISVFLIAPYIIYHLVLSTTDELEELLDGLDDVFIKLKNNKDKRKNIRKIITN